MTDLNNITAQSILAGNNNRIGIVAEFVVNNLSTNSWAFEDWAGGTVENAGMRDIGADLDNRFDVTDHSIHNPKHSTVWTNVNADGLSYSNRIGYPYEPGSSSVIGEIEIQAGVDNPIPDLYRRQFEGSLGSISVGGLLNEGSTDEYLMPHSEYPKVFDVRIDDQPVTSDVVTLELSTVRSNLQTPINVNRYRGNGGKEGGKDVRGQMKPVCIGFPKNITPVDLKDGLYQFHDGSIGPIGEIPWWNGFTTSDYAFYEDGQVAGTLILGNGATDDGSVLTLTPASGLAADVTVRSTNLTDALTADKQGVVRVAITARAVDTTLSTVRTRILQPVNPSGDVYFDIATTNTEFVLDVDLSDYSGIDQAMSVALFAFRDGADNPNVPFSLEVSSMKIFPLHQDQESITAAGEVSGELSVFKVNEDITSLPVCAGIMLYDLNGYCKTSVKERNVVMTPRGLATVEEYIEVDETTVSIRDVTKAHAVSTAEYFLQNRAGVIPTISATVDSLTYSTFDDLGLEEIENTLYGQQVSAYFTSGKVQDLLDWLLTQTNHIQVWTLDGLILAKRQARKAANVVGTITNIDPSSVDRVKSNANHSIYDVVYSRNHSPARAGRNLPAGELARASNALVTKAASRGRRTIDTPLDLENDADALAATVGWYENLNGSWTFQTENQQHVYENGDIVLVDFPSMPATPGEIIDIDYPSLTGTVTRFEVMF